MLLYLSLLGLLLSVLLLFFNGRRYKSSIYLSIFFFLVSFYTFYHHIFVYEKSVFWIALLYVNTASVFYLTGPMAYFYVRSVLTDNARLGWKDAWHFLPTLLHFAANMGYVIRPWWYKWETAEKIVADINFLAYHRVNWFAELFGVQVVYISRPLIALIYTLWSLVLIRRYRHRQFPGISLHKQQGVIYRWFYLFIGFQLWLFLSFASFLLARWPQNAFTKFLEVSDLEFLSAIGLIGLLLTPFLFRRVLYGLPDFEKRRIEMLGSVITERMRDRHPYLAPDFNLLKLAHLIDIPTHHLSFYFREVRRQSFNDYRDELRIAYVKKQIELGKVDATRLETIGQQAGFPSKSSFFKAFKKVMGHTPDEYLSSRQGHIEESNQKSA
jgi:AraC-type DNA-binding domain-containing proteins